MSRHTLGESQDVRLQLVFSNGWDVTLLFHGQLDARLLQELHHALEDVVIRLQSYPPRVQQSIIRSEPLRNNVDSLVLASHC